MPENPDPPETVPADEVLDDVDDVETEDERIRREQDQDSGDQTN